MDTKLSFYAELPVLFFSLIFCDWYTIWAPYLFLWILFLHFSISSDIFIVMVVNVIILILTSTSLKYITWRQWPALSRGLSKHFNLRKAQKNAPSFPSGDCIQAAHYFMMLALLFHNNWLLLFPLITAYGRVYYCCHWIGDTIAGLVLGALLAILAMNFISQPNFLSQYLNSI